jgi:hypothetical protein
MVDEERAIRDRANQEQDVKDKEKKLAMMKMDTSGVYASDIRSLEKELENDYQTLEDNAVDSEIEKIRKQYETEQELREKDLEYTRNALEYKRESYANYQEEVNAILIQGAEYATNWLIQNDASYLQQTSANQVLLRKEYEDTMAKGVAANTAISNGLIEQVDAALQQCKTNAEGFNQGVKDYSVTATAANGEISGTVEEMAEHYGTLVGKVEGLDEAEGNLADAVDDVKDAVERLNDAEQAHYIAEWDRIQKLIDQYKQLAIERELGIGGNLDDDTHEDTLYDVSHGIHQTHTGKIEQGNDMSSEAIDAWYVVNGEKEYAGGIPYIQVSSQPGGAGRLAYMRADSTEYALNGDFPWAADDVINGNYKLFYAQKYATGGYVDYTGPAWVDGTKSHPEYMLNATQTAQFESLVDALSMTYKSPNFSQAKVANAEKTGDTRMEFHINVEGGISSDYDVDRAVERIEKKILDSGKYRNTTVLKNSN